MLALISASMLAGATVPAQELRRREERLIAETIADLPDVLSFPRRMRFRHVYLRHTLSIGGTPVAYLCGEVDLPDPRGPDGWTVFTSAWFPNRPSIHTRQSALVDVDTACAADLGGWDRAHDFSARFESEINRRLRVRGGER